MNDARLMASTALAPILWGTTYAVTTELLPPNRPLLAGVLRALPAGLLMLAALGVTERGAAAPRGVWWWRSVVLGAVNISVFFALLFVAAYRLPGGVAAVFGALGLFMVAGLAVPLLNERPTRRLLLSGAIGVLGVALLVLRSSVVLDPIGLAAAAAGMLSVSLGTVLVRRWGLPAGYARRGTALLALTSWQLVAGGLLLVPIAIAVEGLPATLNGRNVLGFGYLTVISTALAYLFWFSGVTQMRATRVTMLTLLSPIVAAAIGWAMLGQSLTPVQLLGCVAVLGAVLLGTRDRVAPVELGARTRSFKISAHGARTHTPV